MIDTTTVPEGDVKPDVKPDIKDVKPSAAQLRAKKGAPPPPPPEGRIGTLCVMKSGKVKMVMGDDIVMNVGLSSSLPLGLVADSRSHRA